MTLGAFGTYVGASILHLPFALAILLGLAFGTASGLVTERLVIRPLSNRPKVTILVATAALAFIAIPLELIIGSSKFFPARPIIHGLGPKLPIAHVYISWQQLTIIFVLAAIGLLLALFFAFTNLGLATLATSQEPVASRLMGIRVN